MHQLLQSRFIEKSCFKAVSSADMLNTRAAALAEALEHLTCSRTNSFSLLLYKTYIYTLQKDDGRKRRNDSSHSAAAIDMIDTFRFIFLSVTSLECR